MKKFIFNLISNRFGIILAILNLLFITLNRSGISSLLGLDNFAMFAFILNLPARMASTILFEVLLFPKHGFRNFDLNYYSFGTLIFVVFQWLFIGWLTATLAKNLRKITLR